MPIPPDTRAPGDAGHVGDHNAIADVLTAQAAAIAAEVARAEAAEAALAPLSDLPLTVLNGGTGATSTGGALTSLGAAAATALTAETSRAETAEGLAAQKSANLGDIASAATARTNLGLTGAATASLPLAVANGGIGSSTRNWAGLLTPVAVKTFASSPYSAAAGDFVPCDTTSGNVTVTLPNAPPDLTVVAVKHVIQGGTNTVTVACAGSDVYNKAGGGTTLTLTLLNQGAVLQYKASGGIWYVTADDLALSQLDARYTAKNTPDLFLAPSGGDDTSALNAAAAACGTYQTLRLAGTYTTSGTVTFACNLNASDALFNYSGTGAAVIAGSVSSGVNVQWKTFRLPQVIATAKTITGWSQVAGSIGVKLSNLNRCFVYVPHVNFFETGLDVYGTGAGNAYNTITIGHLDCNKINLLLDADSTGWSNQNLFLGGSLSFNSSEGTGVSGTRQIQINSTTSMINNNTFVGQSTEGNVAEYNLYVVAGEDNIFLNLRWESTTPHVRWGPTATRNQIIGGYNEFGISVTSDSGSTKNSIHAPVGIMTLTDATTVLINAAYGGPYRYTILGNRTLGAPSNPQYDGQEILIEVIQDGTGGRTLAYNAAYVFSTDLPVPTLSAAAGARDFLKFYYNAAAGTWTLVGIVQGA